MFKGNHKGMYIKITIVYTMYVAFDKQLKEIGHASLIFIFVSKYFIFLECNLPSDCLKEVNYNKISHLGSPKGDRVRLTEKTV